MYFSPFSPGFLRFVRVLCGMSSDERKAFLQFTTGCSTLPPGGLANLHPRLTVVRKVQTLSNAESKWTLVTSGLKEINIWSHGLLFFTFLFVGRCYWRKLSVSEYVCALSEVAWIFFRGDHERAPARCYHGERLSSQLSFEVGDISQTFKILVKPLVFVCREVYDPLR